MILLVFDLQITIQLVQDLEDHVIYHPRLILPVVQHTVDIDLSERVPNRVENIKVVNIDTITVIITVVIIIIINIVIIMQWMGITNTAVTVKNIPIKVTGKNQAVMNATMLIQQL
jgi:hypothetical protein